MKDIKHIEETIFHLKHPKNFDAIETIPVELDDKTISLLKPVPSELIGYSSEYSKLMASWRNESKKSFFTWITSTEESTKDWLRKTYASDNKNVIFMVETTGHVPYGHMALYNFQENENLCEFGRILRGTQKGPKGGMTAAAFKLLSWAVSDLQISRFYLEVFKDNKKAINLYERLGFRTVAEFPLRLRVSNGITQWEKFAFTPTDDRAADNFALRMEVTAEQLETAKLQLP